MFDVCVGLGDKCYWFFLGGKVCFGKFVFYRIYIGFVIVRFVGFRVVVIFRVGGIGRSWSLVIRRLELYMI